MKKSKVKRFNGLAGSYATGVQGAYADSLARKAKKDKEDRIALDMQDAIEPVYPEALLLGGAARKGVGAAANALERKLLEANTTAEGLPTSAALKRALSQRNPKVITSKDKFEEFSGIRGRHRSLGSPEARNKMYREQARDAGIPYKEYLKGIGKAREEGVAPGRYWGDMFAKGGKVGTVMHEFKAGKLKSSSGQKVTNPKQAIAIAMSEAGKKMKKYAGTEGSEVKKDKPYLGPREKADVKKMEEMQRKSKTPIGDIEPVPGQYGKVKKMAFGGTPKGDMYSRYQQMRGVPKPPAVSPGIRKGIGEAVRGGMGAPDMRALARAPKAYGMKEGGKVEESKAMVKKEIEFFKKKKAPKAMVKHEEKEAKGMKRGGGKVMKFAKGGSIDGCAVRGKTKLKRVKM